MNEEKLKPGDLVFYWGSGILSRLIELFSSNGPSHVQVVEKVDPDGTVWIAESTIDGKLNGVQRHKLSDSIDGYPKGSRVGAALLSYQTRERVDWSQLTPIIDSLVGKVAYDVLGLVKFLEPEGIRIGQINDHKMVCSSFVAAVYERLGIIFGVPYSQASPQLLIQMHLYVDFVPILGLPEPHNFNTI